MGKRIFIAFILFFTCTAFSAHALTTYYADPSGSDTNDGSELSPWPLQYAIQQINAGSPDTYVLNVASGTYSPTGAIVNGALDIFQADVTIVGAGKSSTILDGSFAGNTNGIVTEADNTTIKGLAVTNFAYSGMVIKSVNNTIESCAVYGNTWDGIDIEAGGSANKINTCDIYHNGEKGTWILGSSSNEISANAIYDNGISGTPGTGIYLGSTSSNNQIYSNTVYWTGDTAYPQGTGISFDAAGSGNDLYQNEIYDHLNSGGMGIYVYDASPNIFQNEIHGNEAGIFIEAYSTAASPAIQNNLIYDTTYDPIAVFSYSSAADPTIYHNTIDGSMSCLVYVDGTSASPDIKYNIFSNSDDAGICYSGVPGTPTSDYNLFWNIPGLTHDGFSAGPNDIFDQDPLYSDYTAPNFSLQSESPCIDAIPVTEPDPVTEDFAGATRPQEDGFDIGAYEATYAASGNYTLTVTITPESAGYVADDLGGMDCMDTCSATYQENSTPVFTATAEAGYSFDHWEGDASGSDNPNTVTMDADKAITAVFVSNTDNSPAKTPTAVYPADGAVISATEVTLQASAFSDPEGDAHYRSYWEVRIYDSSYGRDDYPESFTAEVTEGDLTRHTVSGLTSGVQYIWHVGYVDAGSGTTSWSDGYRFTIGSSVTDNSVTVAAGTTTADYRMVSFVQWPDDPTGKDIFGAADTTQFRIGLYDPEYGSGGYREYGNDFKIMPGRAYWLLARSGLNPAVKGVQVSTSIDIDLPLFYNTDSANGWNMIACPNEADYNWSDIMLIAFDDQGNIVLGPTAIADLSDANGYIDKRLWRWENGSYASDTARLEAFNGYWVKAKQAYVYLRFPADKQLARGLGIRALLADLFRTGSDWFERIGLVPETAVADTGDSPPMPPSALSASGGAASGGSGGCFIDAARLKSSNK